MSGTAQWGKLGPEPKIHKAREYAEENHPELARDVLTLSVGYTAWREERDVAEVWGEAVGE